MHSLRFHGVAKTRRVHAATCVSHAWHVLKKRPRATALSRGVRRDARGTGTWLVSEAGWRLMGCVRCHCARLVARVACVVVTQALCLILSPLPDAWLSLVLSFLSCLDLSLSLMLGSLSHA